MYLRKFWKRFRFFQIDSKRHSLFFFFLSFFRIMELRNIPFPSFFRIMAGVEKHPVQYSVNTTGWFGHSDIPQFRRGCWRVMKPEQEAGGERNILSPSRDWRYSRGTSLKLGHRDMSITYSISSLEPRCGGFDVKLKILLVTGTSINFDARPSCRSRNF